MIRVHRAGDAATFLAEAGPFLAEREAEHNLIFGICSGLTVDTTSYEGPPFLAYAERDGDVLAAVLRTPPYNLVLSESDELTWVEPIAREVRLAFDSLPGVLGPQEAVAEFVDVWKAVTGTHARPVMMNRIYRASRATVPAGVPGRMRPYATDDHAPVVRWLEAFVAEAMPTESFNPPAETMLQERLDEPSGDLLVWEVDGAIASMAAYRGPTPHGIRIGPVYTPPELRGRGYATALVGQMTAMLLDRGYRFCFLFTDLANPTSNRIYQRIGYEPVSNVERYTFA